MNPGAADAAATRGTWIHNSVEDYLRGLRVVPSEQYKPYWDGVPEVLDTLLEGGRVLWSEKPFNQPRWAQYVGDDGVGRIHYYNEDTGHGYAGCCDLIYMNSNAEIILADFKTSNGPYSARDFALDGVEVRDHRRVYRADELHGMSLSVSSMACFQAKQP